MSTIESTPEQVFKELSALLSWDKSFLSGKIIGSMCSYPHPIAVQAYGKFIEKNIGDPGLFPATVELEKQVIQMLGSMMSAESPSGSVVTGGTEANILAMWTAKRLYKKKGRKVIVPVSAHFSFDKAADMLDLELVKIPLDKDFKVDIDKVKKAVTDDTIALLGIAGTTGLGVVDDIEALSALAVEKELYLHIDAAFGGFVLPFLKDAGYSAPAFDFSLPGVSSITIDPHKMGRSAIPAGCIIYRNEELAKTVEIPVGYLSGGESGQRTIVGTRSGAAIASVWAVFRHLGRQGYVKIVKECMERTMWLVSEVEKLDGFSVTTTPVTNVVGISPDRPASEVVEAVRKKGWSVSLFGDFMRVVMMPHTSRESLSEFLEDLKQV